MKEKYVVHIREAVDVNGESSNRARAKEMRKRSSFLPLNYNELSASQIKSSQKKYNLCWNVSLSKHDLGKYLE